MNISVIYSSKLPADSNFCVVWQVKLSKRVSFFFFKQKKNVLNGVRDP